MGLDGSYDRAACELHDDRKSARNGKGISGSIVGDFPGTGGAMSIHEMLMLTKMGPK